MRRNKNSLKATQKVTGGRLLERHLKNQKTSGGFENSRFGSYLASYNAWEVFFMDGVEVTQYMLCYFILPDIGN